MAVATARLMNESIRAAEARRSLEVARSIQRSFLPDPVSVPGVEVGGMSEPCDETGGDYIDYFAETGSDGTPTGALYVICGDVSGHGIASALVMSMARAFLRALLPGSNSLADVIARVNRLIEADTPPDQYMTLFIARIDPDAGRLRYVSAGHEPALIRRHDGTILETESTGMPLGMLDFGDFEEREVTINPGDRLFLSTDGLSEAMGPSGERYGRARLLEDVLAWPDSPVDVWVQALHAKVQAFCRPLRFEDDFSVVVAQIR